MPELEKALRTRRDEGRKLLIPYLMGGMTEDWTESLAAVIAAGADAVEVGIPFSDPMMDGPVIQEAALRALGRGTVPEAGGRRHRTGRGSGPDRGDDVLQPRLPGRAQADGPLAGGSRRERRHHRRPSHRGDAGLGDGSRRGGVDTVLLVAPSSPPDRVARICDRARGFVYAVARMGVTGERADLGGDVTKVVERIRRCTDMPVCVGVGVSTPDQAAEVCEVADGVVVGSALVRRLLEGRGRRARPGSWPPSATPSTKSRHPTAAPRRRQGHVARPRWGGRPARRSPAGSARRLGCSAVRALHDRCPMEDVGARAGLGRQDVLRVRRQGGVGDGFAREDPGVGGADPVPGERPGHVDQGHVLDVMARGRRATAPAMAAFSAAQHDLAAA